MPADKTDCFNFSLNLVNRSALHVYGVFNLVSALSRQLDRTGSCFPHNNVSPRRYWAMAVEEEMVVLRIDEEAWKHHC